MPSGHTDKDRQEKLFKLKRMRIIATSLLFFMALVYFIFKKYEGYNLFFSSVAAFAEAAMIGALADWFAVVALFRHPLGMSFIPHTAIIQRNKDRIGESLASFVVSNFFTYDVIKNKLTGVRFSEAIVLHIRERKEDLSRKIAVNLPDILEALLVNGRLSDTLNSEIKSKIRDIDLSPLINSALPALVSSRLHIPLLKRLLGDARMWVFDNKEKTLKIIEGMYSKFTLPIVGDIIYKIIIKMLSKIIDDIEKDPPTEFTRKILYDMPLKLADELKDSEELKENLEKLKNDILDSEQFNTFIEEKIREIKAAMLSYSQNSVEEVKGIASSIFDHATDYLTNDAKMGESIDELIREGIADVVYTYRNEIARLISDTVKGWPTEDMVDKLETQVGGDLQYIRINGTVIGGIAGLTIHLISTLI